MRKAPEIVSLIILVPSNWISKSILVYGLCAIYWVFTKRKSFDFIKTDDLSLKIAFTKEILFLGAVYSIFSFVAPYVTIYEVTTFLLAAVE